MHPQSTPNRTCGSCGSAFYAKPSEAGLYCSRDCYAQARRPRQTTGARFWPKVNRHGPVPDYCPSLGPCWVWTGFINAAGYGRFNVGGPIRAAHRVAYELTVGSIPPNASLDHLCRVRHCVNPHHLEPVSHRENVLRGVGYMAIQARKTCCKRGHPFDDANTSLDRKGCRGCRACKAEYNRAWRDEHRAERAAYMRAWYQRRQQVH